MNNYMPREVRDLSGRKESVKKRVFERIESRRKPKIRWQYPLMVTVLSVSVLMFLSYQILDNYNLISATPVENIDGIADTSSEKIKGTTAGETIKIEDYLEFTIQHHQVGKEINHSDPASLWTISHENEDTIYVDLLLTVTNISDRELFESDDFIQISFYDDNQTEYAAHTIFERLDRNQFTRLDNSIVKPEQTRIVHYIAPVPKEVETDGRPVRAIISIKEELYEYIIK